jgi:6-pyruvoyltetrahydropterin/6-carboxytetrahydropterin synthase
LKLYLEETFDHKVVLSKNDPYLNTFKDLERKGLADLVILDGVGVEMFAKHAYNFADKLVRDMTNGRCWVTEVECAEHGANSAIWMP